MIGVRMDDSPRRVGGLLKGEMGGHGDATKGQWERGSGFRWGS